MMRRWRDWWMSATGVLLAVGCLPGRAAAQAPLGALSRYVHGGVSTSASYDPNSQRGSDAVARARGIKPAEVDYTVTGNIDLSLPVAGFQTFLLGSAGYQGHTQNSKLNSETVSLSGGTSRRFGICGASTGLSWNRGQSLLEGLDLSYTTNVQQSVGVNLSVQCTPIAGVNAGIAASYGRGTNSSSGAVGSSSRSVSGNVGYGNRALGTVSVFASYSRIDYPVNPNRPTAAAAASSGIDSVNVGLQYARPIGRKLSGSASIGYMTTKPDGPVTTKSNDISASVGLNYRPTDRISTSLNYSRSVSATNIVGSSYIYGQTISANLGFKLIRGVSTNLSASQSISDYRGQTPVTGPAAASRLSRDKNRNLTGSVGFSPLRNTSLSASVSYNERSSNVSLFDYNSVRTSVSFSASF